LLALVAGVPAFAEERSNVRVAGIVLKWLRADKQANFRRAEPLIREAAKNGAKVVVTTECFLDGYAVADKSIPLDDYRALGEPIPDGRYYRRLAALADELNIHLIAGMTEAAGEARYNTAVLIGPDGKLAGKYRKQMLGHEAPRNSPGTESIVHQTPFGRVGVMICADRRFPEVVRKFRDNRAGVLICPSGGMFGPTNNDPLLQAQHHVDAPHADVDHDQGEHRVADGPPDVADLADLDTTQGHRRSQKHLDLPGRSRSDR